LENVNIICRAPFKIEVIREEGPVSDMEAYGGWTPNDEDMMYLRVKTLANTFSCRVRRGQLNALFAAIQELGVTVEFNPKPK
jgi:hypothetical protein